MKVLILILSFVSCNIIYSQTPKDSLDSKLTDIWENSDLPGFAVSIINKDSILYKGSFGFANIENRIPYSENTVQTIASVSKTMIAVSTMQLIENGEFNLDTPINKILPFKVKNPNYPDIPITIKHLATHTSSIIDGEFSSKNIIVKDSTFFLNDNRDSEDYDYIKGKLENKDMPMSDYLKNALCKGGIWYSESNFLQNQPGTHYEYSNIAAALLAYIIELKSGLSFSDYTKKEIFKPLKMVSSSWTYDPIECRNYANIYTINKNILPEYKNITYPDGDLMTNISDLSLFFSEILKGFHGTEVQILKKSSINQMLSPQIPQDALPESFKEHKGNYGIFWQINPRGLIGHSGSTPGAFTYMFFDPETGVGKIFLTNITATQDDNLIQQFVEVIRTLNKYDSRL